MTFPGEQRLVMALVLELEQRESYARFPDAIKLALLRATAIAEMGTFDPAFDKMESIESAKWADKARLFIYLATRGSLARQLVFRLRPHG